MEICTRKTLKHQMEICTTKTPKPQMSTRERDPERERERETENERRGGGGGVEQIHSQNWGEEMGFSFTNTSHFSSKKMGFIFMIC
jgi:hypothetical protein